MNRSLFLAQRLSALVLAPLAIGHLVLMIWATGDGLSAEEILARTRGSLGWAAFYGLFVLAAAVHGPIGLRAILSEMTAWRGASLNLAAAGLALAMLWLGGRAVWAVIA